jgi:menaquinone-dependent protoporphyrinogen IX oxidase
MANLRTLLVYYSLSGTTKRLALKLAGSLNADLEEIVPVHQLRPGFMTYVRVGWAAVTRSLMPVRPVTHQVGTYDLVIVGGPVWIGHIAAPVRSWLKASGLIATPTTRFASFVTLTGSGPKAAFAELDELAGRPAIARLAITESDRKAGREAAQVADFVRKLAPLRLAA